MANEEDGISGEVAHKCQFDFQDGEDLTLLITDAVSDVTGTPAQELPPLGYSIDVDSLTNIFRPLPSGDSAAIGTIRFQYADVLVSVHSTGDLRVYQTDE